MKNQKKDVAGENSFHISDLTGYSPATCRVYRAAVRPGAPSPAGGLWAPELPRLSVPVCSACSTAPGSLSLGLCDVDM